MLKVQVENSVASKKWYGSSHLIQKYVADFSRRNSFLSSFEEALRAKTATFLYQWVDSIEMSYSQALEAELLEAGFVRQGQSATGTSYAHPDFPLGSVILKDDDSPFCAISIRVNSLGDFLMANNIHTWIEGSPLSPLRRSCISKENGIFVYAIERRAPLVQKTSTQTSDAMCRYLQCYEQYQTRTRKVYGQEEHDALRNALFLAEDLVHDIGQDAAVSLILRTEIQYWQMKNRAAAVQNSRQEQLGLGWQNVTMLSFRTSRCYFADTVRFFRILGFHPDSYAWHGNNVGYGILKMEYHPNFPRIQIEVDLSQEEGQQNFADRTLEEWGRPGIVGFWCAVNGQSLLSAGVSRVEILCNFEEMESQLRTEGIEVSGTSIVGTNPEIWNADPERIQLLFERKLITREKKEELLSNGCEGSSLGFFLT
jgi:hypothetical protein